MTPEARDSLFVAVTVDVDPDSNRAAPGRLGAVSPGAEGRAAFAACRTGLAVLLDALEARGLPATLFWEGRTLRELSDGPGGLPALPAAITLEHGGHGYLHEDFAGVAGGRPPDAAETAEAVRRTAEAVRDVLGVQPRGFRAPYCRLTPGLAHALADAGWHYDASLTRSLDAGCDLRPYAVPGEPRLRELSLCRSLDARGRPISAYLWQMLEGRRPPDDYLALVRTARARCPGGLLQIALHPWHLTVSAEGVATGDAPVRRLHEFLDRLVALPGVAFTTAGAYLEANS
ncbi:MAG: polysaccharide deacetylase family protein [Candidatus Brocadiaceae bacterium]|nr:polysaccharide deacetylase family protein [Candidatus Brocadiaceae bacterium]